jgi:predicted PurR-regulated permease PerM
MIAERVLMGLLIGGIAAGCALVLKPFLSAMLWAAILCFTTWPLATWLTTRARLPRWLASLLMVLATAIVLLLPLVLAAPSGAGEIHALRRSVEDFLADIPPAPGWLAALPLVGATLAEAWDAAAADLSTVTAGLRPYLGAVAENGLSLLLGFAGGVAQVLFALFIAFFFWLSGEALGRHATLLVHRIAGPYAPELLAVVRRTVRGTVYGILGTAVIQGFLTAFGLAVTGVPRPVLLATVAGFIAVLPIGAPVVWIPAGLWLLAGGHTARGLFLLGYGTLIVSGADHIIRPYFISRGARLPFLLVVLGVLGGALAFGFLGIFLGPVLLGLGHSLLLEFAGAGRGRPAPAPAVPVQPVSDR